MAWSWERDEGSSSPKRGSRQPSGDEGMPAPPNTGHSSLAPSRPDSAPRSQATTPGSDPPTPNWTTRHSGALTHSPPPLTDSATPKSNIAKQLSSLTDREKFQLIARDSMDIHRKHLEERKSDRSNPLLASARDSFLLNKSRLDKYPRSDANRLVQPTFSRLTIGGLSPILDASPPDPRQSLMKKQRTNRHPSRNGSNIVPERELPMPKQKAASTFKGIATSTELRGHPASDHDCPICSIERPRSTAQAQRG